VNRLPVERFIALFSKKTRNLVVSNPITDVILQLMVRILSGTHQFPTVLTPAEEEMMKPVQ